MPFTIRRIEAGDETEWRKHWAAYNEFYQRKEDITEDITATTFNRFLSTQSHIDCAVAVQSNEGDPTLERVVGFVTYFPHPSTYSIQDVVYLEDLFVDPEQRNGGVGRKLIEYVYAEADKAGYTAVYEGWDQDGLHYVCATMICIVKVLSVATAMSAIEAVRQINISAYEALVL
ncbi:hypothetical protein LTR37_020273 [Vermiconidia calcicola]|uniref:Uncharacterized protein n=1 Tax=Vermiconidia calcicola TaxID=1690605 RepID=A0ACC3MBR0_9PEZI|nr:hypothetical protein LTR37_020273 [Vermiconidia calcicola]